MTGFTRRRELSRREEQRIAVLLGMAGIGAVALVAGVVRAITWAARRARS